MASRVTALASSGAEMRDALEFAADVHDQLARPLVDPDRLRRQAAAERAVSARERLEAKRLAAVPW